MEKLEKVYRMLENELDLIANRGELSNSSLESVYKLTCAMKNLKKIMSMDDYSQRGYSNEGSYRRGRSNYSGEGSYYSGERSNYSGEGSRRGYSGAPIKEHLENAMMDARDERTREDIRRILERM